MGRMCTPSDSDNTSGAQNNAAYSQATTFNRDNAARWLDLLDPQQRALYEQAGKQIAARQANPMAEYGPDWQKIMGASSAGALNYSSQMPSFQAGYINPAIDALEKTRLNRDFYGYGNDPGTMALAEEQFAGPGGYWGSARARGIMDTYNDTVTRPYDEWRQAALQQSYQNALMYANQAGNIYGQAQEMQGLPYQAARTANSDALTYANMRTQDYLKSTGYVDPAAYAAGQGYNAGSNGMWGTIGGIAGTVLGNTIGAPYGGSIWGPALGSAIGSGFDTNPTYGASYGMTPQQYYNSMGGAVNQAQTYQNQNKGYNYTPLLNGIGQLVTNAYGGNGYTGNIPITNPYGANYSGFTQPYTAQAAYGAPAWVTANSAPASMPTGSQVTGGYDPSGGYKNAYDELDARLKALDAKTLAAKTGGY